jgi:ribonuclease III
VNSPTRLPTFITDHSELWSDPNSGDLFAAALTRRAWLLEKCVSGENDHESLEWLGDRVLNAIVAQELWRRFAFAEPGRLDLLRKDLCGGALLAEVARRIDLADWLRMGEGERSQKQAETDASLSDHIEAVLGAALLAGGWPGAEAVVLQLFEGLWPEVLPADGDETVLDPMSELTHLVNRIWRRSLDKNKDWQTERSGPDNAPVWVATVTLPNGECFVGEPISGPAKAARASAASKAVAHLRAGDN